MDIDPKFADLINAEIDGWIAPEEHVELETYLAENDAASAYRNELTGLCEDLDSLETVSPPPHLKHVILDAVTTSNPARQETRQRTSSDLFSDFFGTAPVRYAMSFAAGVILAYTLLSSEQISRQALDDVADLVGTITQPEAARDLAAADDIQLTLNELAGLTSQGPVDIVAAFADPDIWFNGFAQLESAGTSVAAENGRVTLHMEGQRRYALYLNNTSQGAATVNLRFYANGQLVHEDDLVFGEDN